MNGPIKHQALSSLQISIEVAARQLCILREEDPDELDSFSNEPAWKAAALEIERFLVTWKALQIAGINLGK